ncbi:hypothetical protein O3P69_006942 [Scylla paramamosain]|uniref:Uncharacterized protein n=1 Tax=Scylla paramamosain TaxID=85552 RepID=A0AAW0U5C3_SCYPA
MKRNTKSQVTLDGFVVRSSKVSPSSSPIKELGMRQATLESLKGVVVVEEMERARVVLERNDVSTELKVDTLQHLLRKTPAKEVLIKTKLGKTVHKLCRAEEGEVAAAAQQVYTSWKNHILSKVNRPYIEVKCDLKTQKLRSSAKQIKNHEEGRSGDRGEQREARGTQDTQQDSVDTIADHLEREVYQVYTRRVDNRYRRTIRSMIFALRHQRDVRKAVVLATLSVEDFVSQHMKT